MHLFQLFEAKAPRKHHCLADLVRFRISPFAKSCYASYRPCLADHLKLWIDENGYVFWKLCWHEVSHVNMFLLDSSLLAWFRENGCCIIDVHCLLIRMVCSLAKSGKNVLRVHELVLFHWNPNFWKPRTVLIRWNSYLVASLCFCMGNHCYIAMNQSACDIPLSETQSFT